MCNEGKQDEYLWDMLFLSVSVSLRTRILLLKERRYRHNTEEGT